MLVIIIAPFSKPHPDRRAGQRTRRGAERAGHLINLEAILS